jgi:hypothetical protein
MATFIAGKYGYVKIGVDVVGWAFSSWDYHPRCKILPKNTFIAGGYDDNIGGFIGADVRLEGPQDMDQTAPLIVGDVYVLHLGITETGPIEFTLSVRIADIEASNNAEDEPTWVVSAVSKGAFNPAIPQTGVLRAGNGVSGSASNHGVSGSASNKPGAEAPAGKERTQAHDQH